MKKTILILIILTILVQLYSHYYRGALNPRVLIINNTKIITPSMYYLYNAVKNYDIIDITCHEKPWCSKNITLEAKTNDNIILFYQGAFSSDDVTLNFSTTKKTNVQIFKNTFFKGINPINLEKCLISRVSKGKSYNYKILSILDGNNVFIQINTTNKLIAESYVKDFCK